MKQRVFGIILPAAALLLCGCGANIEVIDSMEVEAGTELSSEIADYVTLAENVSLEEASLNLEHVDIYKIGTYPASVTCGDKDYEFEVHVVDTTAPDAELKEAYTLTQPGTLTASDYIENIEDATETTVGFLEFSKAEDLRAMTDEDLKEKALDFSEELVLEEGMTFSETAEASEDGIYTGRIAVKDEAGNMKVFDHTFYVDGTAPVIEGLEDTQVTANADGTFEFDFSNISVIDNLDGDITEAVSEAGGGTLVYNNDSDGKKESYTIKIQAADRAGNAADKSAVYTVVMPSGASAQSAESAAQSAGTASREETPAQSAGSAAQSAEETEAAGTPASTPANTSDSSSKDAQARAVAQSIAAQCTDGTDLERVTKAAQIVAGYCAAATYTTEDPDYRTAYGVFCKGVYTCAGSTRAMGMVLECMGFGWSHANENQWTHQWCIVTLDGQTGYADGMAGLAGYGEFPYL